MAFVVLMRILQHWEKPPLSLIERLFQPLAVLQHSQEVLPFAHPCMNCSSLGRFGHLNTISAIRAGSTYIDAYMDTINLRTIQLYME